MGKRMLFGMDEDSNVGIVCAFSQDSLWGSWGGRCCGSGGVLNRLRLGGGWFDAWGARGKVGGGWCDAQGVWARVGGGCCGGWEVLGIGWGPRGDNGGGNGGRLDGEGGRPHGVKSCLRSSHSCHWIPGSKCYHFSSQGGNCDCSCPQCFLNSYCDFFSSLWFTDSSCNHHSFKGFTKVTVTAPGPGGLTTCTSATTGPVGTGVTTGSADLQGTCP